MRLAFITSSDQPVYCFAELAKAVSTKAPGMSVEEFFVPSVYDIPFTIKQSKDFDLILACYLFDSESDASTAIEFTSKLMDVELMGTTRVVKMVEALDSADYDSADHWAELRDELVEKWSNIILGLLFDPTIFKPVNSFEDDENDGDQSEEEVGREK